MITDQTPPADPAPAPDAAPSSPPDQTPAAPTPSDVAGLAEGRIVHYRTPGAAACRATIVVYVWRGPTGELPADGLCNLAVFRDGTSQGDPVALESAVVYSAEVRDRTWHWPERA